MIFLARAYLSCFLVRDNSIRTIYQVLSAQGRDKMSSFGGQWRVIRHYLSMTNLNAEVEKLVQKIKPATPEQWDSKYLNLKHTKKALYI